MLTVHPRRRIDHGTTLCKPKRRSRPAVPRPAPQRCGSRQRQSTSDEQVTKKKQPDLEKSLTELEEIVELLEEGDIPLEEALKQFEKGVKLSRDCQTALQAAEQRVQVLMDGELQDFATDAASDDD